MTVITRDVFNLGAGYGGGLPTSPKFWIFDANDSGRGQRIEYMALFDPERSPFRKAGRVRYHESEAGCIDGFPGFIKFFRLQPDFLALLQHS